MRGNGRVTGALAAIAIVVSGWACAPALADEPPQTDIVGGSTTTIQEWPWQVRVQRPGRSCGGSLIAPSVVVTAAHCVHSGSNFESPLLYEAITGRTTLSSSEGQEIAVADISVAVNAGGTPLYESAGDPTPSGPDLYNPSTLRWDVVFLTLDDPSTSTPIKIAGPTETALWEPGRAAWATGWGATSDGGSGSDVLREVEIHMISDPFCSGAYGSGFSADVMVCAGEIAGGKDTCQGDSGGPLVSPMAAGGFRLVGDTSWGVGCAQPNLPGVYGRLAADPIRTPLAAAILAETGVDVLGAGGTPPPGPPPPPPPPPPVDPVCEQAQDEVDRAKRRHQRAKRRLQAAQEDGAGEKRIDRAERRVKLAKRKLKRVREKRDEACAPS